MNWLNVFGLTLGGLVLFFSLLRVERRALILVVVLLFLPAILVIGRWASVGQHWPETLAGFSLAGLVAGIWWLAVGRKLPAPTSDNIKVWGQENPPRSKAQENAALQAEVLRLKEETARLEDELRRLKAGPKPDRD